MKKLFTFKVLALVICFFPDFVIAYPKIRR